MRDRGSPSRANAKGKQLLSNEDGKVSSEKSSASKSESERDREKQLVSQKNKKIKVEEPSRANADWRKRSERPKPKNNLAEYSDNDSDDVYDENMISLHAIDVNKLVDNLKNIL